MATCPPLLVAPPPTRAAVGGLFAVAGFPELPSDGNGNRWECGIQYQAKTCARPYGWQPACPPDAPLDKVPSLEFGLTEGKPFTVILGINCMLPGNTLTEFRDAVVDAFTLCEQRSAEEIFWAGSTHDPENPDGPRIPLENNSLSRPDAAPEDQCVALGTVDEPLSVTAGVAALEQYLGDNYCGQGVIHAPRAVSAYAARASLTCQCGTPQVSTPLGTRWAFGGGYAVNTGPDGVEAPAGVAWMYATGQVNILRSEVWINPDELVYAFNTRNNQVELYAERTYVITTECVCAAVPVSLGCDC
jgi:hypothetical protein